MNPRPGAAPPAPVPAAGRQSGPPRSGTAAPGRRRRRPGGLRLWGPAFVAAVAYVDPGNFAVNVSAGAVAGYSLLWVVVAASLMAFLVQHLAARLGLATGAGLCDLVRRTWPPWATWLYWLQAEVVCAATDLAEIVGAAFALNLLCGLALPLGGAAAVGWSLLCVALAGRQQVLFERVTAAMLGAVLLAFAVAGALAGVRPGGVAAGMVPSTDGHGQLLLITGIVGATIMPHAVYLHSALTPRVRRERPGDVPATLRGQRADVSVAMTLAGLGNAGLLVVAAAALGGHADAGTTLVDAHTALADRAPALGILFALALLLAGLAASSVGTLAGQIVMDGLLRRTVPRTVRRTVTALPALLVLCCCQDPTGPLVVSQVVLSFGVPFALVPLVLAAGRIRVMGDWAAGRGLVALAACCTALVVALNALLLWQIR